MLQSRFFLFPSRLKFRFPNSSFVNRRHFAKISPKESKLPDCRETVKNVVDRFLINATFPDTLIKDFSPLNSVPKTIYAGFDPTAASLHLGHLLVINSLMHFYAAGFDVIALIGEATGKLGDPSGRLTERKKIDWDVLKDNAESIKMQLERLFQNFEEYVLETPDRRRNLKPIRFVNNAQWYENVDVIRFVADVGPCFPLHHMFGKESVRQRSSVQGGMNFAEFAYQLFQAYDWTELYKEYGCLLQVGGADQIGNMHSGHDLIKAVHRRDAFGLAAPLLLDEKGQKLGKSTLDGQLLAKTVWLDSARTSPFEMYQYFLRSADADVSKFLHYFTFLPLDEVEKISAQHDRNTEQRIGQTKIADEVTLLVHGPEGLASAQRCTDALYRGSLEKVSRLSEEEFEATFRGASWIHAPFRNGISLYEVVTKLKPFLNTGGEKQAMDQIRQGAISVNFQKIKEPHCVIVQGVHILPNGSTLIRLGKKNYFVIKWH